MPYIVYLGNVTASESVATSGNHKLPWSSYYIYNYHAKARIQIYMYVVPIASVSQLATQYTQC